MYKRAFRIIEVMGVYKQKPSLTQVQISSTKKEIINMSTKSKHATQKAWKWGPNLFGIKSHITNSKYHMKIQEWRCKPIHFRISCPWNYFFFFKFISPWKLSLDYSVKPTQIQLVEISFHSKSLNQISTETLNI